MGAISVGARGIDLVIAARLVDVEDLGKLREGSDACAAGGLEEKGVLVDGVGVRGLVAWTCVRAEGQETKDGVWLG